MSTWNDPELIKLFSASTPLIDVRAPVEFAEGSIPNSINLPIMNDEERRMVGTCYKEHGQASAIELGHELVSGQVKEKRIELWKKTIEERPETEVFCFRGGLRSQITCQWINEHGLNKKPITGGYKRMRTFFLSWLNEAPIGPLIRLGGLTGSGKTIVLKKFNNHIDIEHHANHRGSAFGPNGPQPSQITFENKMALDLLRLQGKRIVVEDESATLGKITVPKRLFAEMRAAPLIILEVEHEERLQIIFDDYVKNSNPEFFVAGLTRIEKRIGPTKLKALSEEIISAYKKPLTVSAHEGWISTLLKEYYDPLYQKDLRYNQDKVIFRGKEKEIVAFLASL
jgi:tRNA 2-selenouridine synthase